MCLLYLRILHKPKIYFLLGTVKDKLFIVLGSFLIVETQEIFYEVLIPKKDAKTLFASSNEV